MNSQRLGFHTEFLLGKTISNVLFGTDEDIQILSTWLPVLPTPTVFLPLPQNMAVTDAIQKVAVAYHCNPVEGILSHQLRKNSYESDKTIILNPSEQQRWAHTHTHTHTHMHTRSHTHIPYSRKIWRELNLAKSPKTAKIKYWRNLNLAIARVRRRL